MPGTNRVELNELDRRVLKLLNQNSSLPPETIGEQLSIDVFKVEHTIERLENFVDRFAVIDPRKVGFTVPGYAFAQCQETYETAIDESLKYVNEHMGVQSIGTLYGEYDIVIRKLSDDVHRLNNFATNAISYSTAQKTCPTTELIRSHGIDLEPDEWKAGSYITEELTDSQKTVLRKLQDDPTLKNSLSELAEETDLDLQTVSDAVKSLEKRDIIIGYSINLDRKELGWGKAYFGISTLSDLPPTQNDDEQNYNHVIYQLLQEVPDDELMMDNLHIPHIGSGLGMMWADIFIEIIFESMDHLDRLTDKLREMSGVKTTRTYIEANAYYSNATVPLR